MDYTKRIERTVTCMKCGTDALHESTSNCEGCEQALTEHDEWRSQHACHVCDDPDCPGNCEKGGY